MKKLELYVLKDKLYKVDPTQQSAVLLVSSSLPSCVKAVNCAYT